MSSASRPTLRQWLAAEGGAVPFRRFMEAALYDPDFGYYTSRIRTVGPRGDFATSASLSPRLARAVAAWIAAEAPEDCRDLIEIGPGSGVLHQALRQALGWRGRWRWRSHLVERSPGLRAAQQRLLGRGLRRMHWHDDLASALRAAGGRALIFSNELVDAFPVTLLQAAAGTWQEVWLELLQNGSLVETLRPVASVATGLAATDFPEGQRIEVHDSWQDWFRAWRPSWQAGAMLTIDYGDTARQLYHRRPHGTLRGYHQHRRLEGAALYADPGHCDLTADVNFTDLILTGETLGLETLRLESQAAFLDRYSRAESVTGARLADPGGAGGAFQCLVQRIPPSG